MPSNIKLAIAAVSLFSCCGTVFLANQGNAGDDPKVLAKKVDAIAAAVSKNNKAAVKKFTNTLAKEQEEDGVYYVMLLFKTRKRKGYGMGSKPGAITPDGIEKFIREVADNKVAAGVLAKEKAALIELANRSAAVAAFCEAPAMVPAQKVGKKSAKNWLRFTVQMRSASNELIKAVKAGKVAAIQKSLTKLDGSCNQCHSFFR